MKYDKDTMNSLQEAYDSVNEGMYKGGKFVKSKTNPKTGLPLINKIKRKKQKKRNKKDLITNHLLQVVILEI